MDKSIKYIVVAFKACKKYSSNQCSKAVILHVITVFSVCSCTCLVIVYEVIFFPLSKFFICSSYHGYIFQSDFCTLIVVNCCGTKKDISMVFI